MKILFVNGLGVKSSYYDKFNIIGDVDFFEWWKIPDVSIETIYNKIKNYSYIISHSAGSTIVYATMMIHNKYFNRRKIKVLSFDAHLINLEKPISGNINTNIIIKHTLGALKITNDDPSILKHVSKFNNNSPILREWTKMMLNINLAIPKNIKLTKISWFELHCTQVCKGMLYVPFKTYENKCDVFCNSLRNSVPNREIFALLDETHYTLCYKTNCFIGLINNYFIGSSNLPSIHIPSSYKKSDELGTNGVESIKSDFYVKKLPYNGAQYHQAKIIVLDKTINWSHNWPIKVKVDSGEGLEINTRHNFMHVIEKNNTLTIKKNEAHFFVRGLHVLRLDVKAFLKNILRKTHIKLSYPKLF